MNFVITLTGPSASGKSTVVECIQAIGPKFGINPQVIKKYTTRAARPYDTRDVVSVDDIPKKCDLVYEQYGVRYGIESSDLFACLANGGAPLVIVNDVRTVADIRTMLGPLTRTLFLFRSFPKLRDMRELATARGVVHPHRDAQERFAKAAAIYRIYIENIHLFDHVLINAGTIPELEHEVEVVIRGFGRADRLWPLRPYESSVRTVQ
ncbi:MAG TPA: hypothetical protein VK669_13530 [Candidatus Limnocylindrales bacterium]|nr:hypothetical protein [Candidatus Limnocylindrales bacterium]